MDSAGGGRNQMGCPKKTWWEWDAVEEVVKSLMCSRRIDCGERKSWWQPADPGLPGKWWLKWCFFL